MDRAALIRHAAAELEEAAAGLDQTAHTCEACGLNVKHDFAGFQAATYLYSTAGRLKRLAEDLERAPSAPKEK